MEPALLNRVDEQAERLGMSFARFLSRAAEKMLGKVA
jgi:hypothetical protein